MKLTLTSFSILFLVAACTSKTNRNEGVTDTLDPLPLPVDSTTFYFNTKFNWDDSTTNTLDTFTNQWYSKMLFALQEPVLKDYTGDREIYRFTWLGSFNHPVVVRLEKQGQMVQATSKVSDGAGGYEPGKIIFNKTTIQSQKQVDTLNLRLEEAEFWTAPTEIRRYGDDGSEWIVEAYKDKKYHLVTRWTPDHGNAFRRIGEYLLSISGIKNETNGW